MLNSDETRRLLPYLAGGLPQVVVQKISDFLGDNHLHMASELRQVAEAMREASWKKLCEAEILPLAKRGLSEVAVRADRVKSYFKGADFRVNEVIKSVAEGHGIVCNNVFGKGKGRTHGGSFVFSWRDATKAPAVRSSVATELALTSAKAQRRCIESRWAKFFGTELLPKAKLGHTKITIAGTMIDRFFNPAWCDDFVTVAKGKAVHCVEYMGAPEKGCKGKGKKGRTATALFTLTWSHINLSDVDILRSDLTGLELLKVASRARDSMWDNFFRSTLMPKAEAGLFHHEVGVSNLMNHFPFLTYQHESEAPCLDDFVTLAQRKCVDVTYKWHSVQLSW